MRFEVKAGGIIVIFFALAALSASVFMLGMKAGYDIAQQSTNDADKLTTTYPLAAPPSPEAVASVAPPAASASTAFEAPVSAVPASTKAAPAVTATPAPPPAVANISESTGRAVPPPGSASVKMPPMPAAPAPAAEAPAVASYPPRNLVHKPFNIEIQAAMDSASARQMLVRLQNLGYQPHLTPTQINGATWYKVEVGPYATKAEAAAAEIALRRKYNATFGRGAAAAQPAAADESPEE